MIVRCLEPFQGCLTEGKEYIVHGIDGQYIWIVEDSGRLNWNWIGIFQKITLLESPKLKMRVNWEVI